jgi:uncharacterized protein
MRISVIAKPLSKQEKIEELDSNVFIINVKEAPVKGAANKAIIKLLSNHFKVGLSDVKLVSGFSFKNKIFDINI